MKTFTVRFTPEASDDLAGIYDYIAEQSASSIVAGNYVDRIAGFVEDLKSFPQRGSLRSEVRPGLRVIGFERSVSIAFVVEANTVVILRILAGGRTDDFQQY